MSFLSLPNEMIEKIFKEFDLNEILGCRLVSRRCQQVVDSIRITGSLIVKVYQVSNLKRDSLVREFNGSTSVFFKTKSLKFLESKLVKKMLSKLENLALSSVSIDCKQDLQKFESKINGLKQLDHLQIGEINLKSTSTHGLQFNHLRKLTILASSNNYNYNYSSYYSSNRSDNLILTAPALTNLSLLINSPFSFKLIINADGLRHLALTRNALDALSGYPKDKIECLRFEKYTHPTKICEVILPHPALRELHIKKLNKLQICEIIKQKMISRNPNLVIYFSGFPIDDLGDVEQLFGDQTWPWSVSIPYAAERFQQIRLTDLHKEVNYSELIGYSDRLSSDAFASKFIGIELVEVGTAVDCEANFIRFLNKYKSLKGLVFTNSPFGQAFFDDLHTHCPSLEVLRITTEPQRISNPDFLLRLSRLRVLQINRDLSLAFVDRLIKLAPNRSYVLTFQMKGNSVELYQEPKLDQDEESDEEYEVARPCWFFTFKGHTFSFSSDLNRKFDIIAALNDFFSLV